jgi:heat shock protein HtpX
MNQRQWIPVEDSPASSIGLINKISWLFVAVVSAVLLIVGFLLSLNVIPAVVGGVLTFLLMRSVRRNSESVALSQLPSMAASEVSEARLFNVVDGLCVVGGDQRPALRIANADFPVAIAVAAPNSAGTIVVSSGFVATMDRVETEAVMAHLLSRIRNGDVALSTFMISLAALLARLGLSVVAQRLSAKLSDSRRLIWADIAGCQATRYPPAMVSALEKVQSHKGSIGDLAVTQLWFAVPGNQVNDTTGVGKLPIVSSVPVSVAERIAVLKEI